MSNQLHIDMVLTANLKPSKNVVRRHSAAKLKKLQGAIETSGFLAPLLVDGEHHIVDGHARHEVAIKLGYEHVPTISVAHLTKAQIALLKTAINRLPADARWDGEALSLEFEILQEAQIDLDLTGFSVVEIENVLDIDGDAPGDVESVDLSSLRQPVVTRPGDIWKLSDGRVEHRILCGDMIDKEARVRLFGDRQATIVFTDPPYNVPIHGHVSSLGPKVHAEFTQASGEMSRGEFQSFLSRMTEVLDAHTAPGALLYVCMDWRSIADLCAATEAQGFEQLNLAVWTKTNPGQGSFYRSQHELIGVYKKPGAPHRNNVELGKHGRSRSNVWQYRGVNVFGVERPLLREHPTVKPSQLVADALRDASAVGDLVFDPFLGSGTTIIAAQRSRRVCYGIEIEPRFVDLAIRRWEDETGHEAVREQDGMTFATAAAIVKAGADQASAQTQLE